MTTPLRTRHVGHEVFCRNPLHPGPCARFKIKVPSTGYRVPRGFKISGMQGGGWSPDPDNPQIAEMATIAHHYGFKEMRYDWRSTGGLRVLAQVRPDQPDVLLVGDADQWADLEDFKVKARTPKLTGHPRIPALPAGRGWMMPQAQEVESVAQYAIPHEAGHRDAFKRRGVHNPDPEIPSYVKMGQALAEWARSAGVKHGGYPSDPRLGHDFRPEDFSTHQTWDVLAPLLGHGFSEYTFGAPAEMYAELFAAHQLGSDAPPVLAVAKAYGWKR